MYGQQPPGVAQGREDVQQGRVVQHPFIGRVGLERGEALCHGFRHVRQNGAVDMLEDAVKSVIHITTAFRLFAIGRRLMQEPAALRPEARMLDDGCGAAPRRGQRPGLEAVRDVRALSREVEVGVGVDAPGHDHAARNVHHPRAFGQFPFVEAFAQLQNPFVLNENIRIENPVRPGHEAACDQRAHDFFFRRA